jgi:carbon-monoxide dehydrogenase medium subunit
MKAAPFEYLAPRSIEEALLLLECHGERARPLAGGQSLVPMMAMRLVRPGVLIDLNRIAALAGIELAHGILRIGAMTRQAELLASPLVRSHTPLLAEALSHVGHPPTRRRGTLGGSLAHADPSAELPAAIVALDARLVLQSRNGQRRCAATEFFKEAFETALAPGELLTEIEIPLTDGGWAFLEISPRKGDFALIAAASRLELAPDGRCRSCALVLAGVAPRPVRCAAVERNLLGRRIDAEAIARAVGALAAEDIQTQDRLASRMYRQRVAPVIAHRALNKALARNGSRAQ